jgi:hypothetical protein
MWKTKNYELKSEKLDFVAIKISEFLRSLSLAPKQILFIYFIYLFFILQFKVMLRN